MLELKAVNIQTDLQGLRTRWITGALILLARGVLSCRDGEKQTLSSKMQNA